MMHKNWKKYLLGAVVTLSFANGYWASLTQGAAGKTESAPVVLSMLSVWACYFSISWLFEGMKSK
jgi:hypothetical protein